MKQASQTVRTIDLGYEQMLVIDGGRDTRLRVLFGATWLTEEGRSEDSIVRQGGEVGLRGRRAVVEALLPAQVQVVTTDQPVRTALRWWIGRIAGQMRQSIGRLQLGAPDPDRA